MPSSLNRLQKHKKYAIIFKNKREGGLAMTEYLLCLDNVLALVLLFLILCNYHISKSTSTIVGTLGIIGIAMAICSYTKESGLYVTIIATRYGKPLLNVVSKIRLTPSRSMPDLSSIDLFVILRVTYYKFVTMLCAPITCYMVDIRQKLIEIYQEIAVRMKNLFMTKTRNNAFLYS